MLALRNARASAESCCSSGITANAASAIGVLLALERRQRQQIVDEPLHVPCLLVHELEVARALVRVEVEVLQRLDKPRDDRQRGLQLVRDVGDEVAPHPGHRFQSRDVAGNQEPFLDAERNDLDRQRRARLALRLDDDGVGVVARFQITDEFGLPCEIRQRLAPVTCEIEAEQALRTRIRPANPVRRIEDDHAVGQRLRRAAEALDRVREVALVGAAHPDTAIQQGQHATPGTTAFGHRRVHRRAGPARQQRQMPEVVADDAGRAEGEHGQRPGGAQRERSKGGQHRDRHRSDESGQEDRAHAGNAAAAPQRGTASR